MKLKLFQKYLKKQNLDLAFLIHPDINITYFTQIKPSYSFLIIAPNYSHFYLTSLDQKPELKDITIYNLKKGWEDKLKDSKIKRIGINKEAITLSAFEKIKKIFPQAKFIDIKEELKTLRAQKTPEEIQKISSACKITDKCFNSLLEELDKSNSQKLNSSFKTELQLANFLENQFQENGVQASFPTIVASASNSAIPHHITSNQKLRKGFLLLDLGVFYQNYSSDMSRTIYLGTPGKEEIARYQLLQDCQSQALQEIKEGKDFLELDKSVRHKLGKYSSHFIHSLGHGVGLEIHESPYFNQSQKIQKNQIFTLEPGIYFYQKYGIRIEDTLLFDGKVRTLTKSNKELLTFKI